jgi:hypothetical protein
MKYDAHIMQLDAKYMPYMHIPDNNSLDWRQMSADC